MKEKEFTTKMNEIQEKLGKEASNLILDDIAILINDNKEMNKLQETQLQENENLKKTNETLQKVNGNLLQQVSMGTEDEILDKKQEEKKNEPFDFRSCFDEKRKF